MPAQHRAFGQIVIVLIGHRIQEAIGLQDQIEIKLAVRGEIFPCVVQHQIFAVAKSFIVQHTICELVQAFEHIRAADADGKFQLEAWSMLVKKYFGHQGRLPQRQFLVALRQSGAVLRQKLIGQAQAGLPANGAHRAHTLSLYGVDQRHQMLAKAPAQIIGWTIAVHGQRIIIADDHGDFISTAHRALHRRARYKIGRAAGRLSDICDRQTVDVVVHVISVSAVDGIIIMGIAFNELLIIHGGPPQKAYPVIIA